MRLARLVSRTVLVTATIALVVAVPRGARGEEGNPNATEEAAEDATANQPQQPRAEVKANTTCELCGKEFGTPQDLVVHQALQYGRTVPILVTVLTKTVREPEVKSLKAQLSLWTGSGLLYAGQPEKALPLLRKAVEGLPESATAHAQLGRALKATGDAEEAQQHLGKAQELDPAVALDGSLAPDAEYTFVPREFVAELQGDFADSVARTVPKPVLAELNAWLAGYYYDAKKAELTTEAAQRATELDPLNPHARSFLGLVAAETGECARAANEVRTALKIDSADPWVKRAAVAVSAKCQTDVIPPEILLVSPLEGETVARRTDLELEVRDDSGRLCHVLVNRITVSGRARKLAELPGVNGRHKVHWRDMKWPALGDDVIEVVATDAYLNTSQARFRFTGRK